MSTKRGPELRHEYVVDASYQYRYAAATGLMGAAGAVAVGVTLYLSRMDLRERLALSPTLAQEFARTDSHSWFLAAAVTLGVSLALGVVGVFLSHRIAGPIFVMTRHLSALAGGRYPKMRPLRAGDAFSDFFDLFQQAVGVMKARDLEEATRILEAVNRLTPSASTPDAQAALAALMAIHDRKVAAGERTAQLSQSTSL